MLNLEYKKMEIKKVKVTRQLGNIKMLPKALRGEIQKKISSVWLRESQDLLRGLTSEEEVKYLPSIVGIQPKSEHWEARIREYWADMTIPIPEQGIELNITKKENGEPVNLMDYIKYNFIMKHPEVAKTEEEKENVTFFKFVLVDLAEAKKAEVNAYKAKKDADAAFVLLTQGETADKKRIRHLLEVLKQTGESFRGLEPLELEMLLNEKKDANPIAFLEATKDPQLSEKATLAVWLEAGVITMNGNTYFNGADPMGTLEEAIVYLNSPSKSGEVAALKERYKGAIK